MGSFISDNPLDSFDVLNQLVQLEEYGSLFLGISRKGFLKHIGANTFAERDWIGSLVTALCLKRASPEKLLYFRTHNVSTLKKVLLDLEESV